MTVDALLDRKPRFVVDGDAHIYEPPDLITAGLPSALRSRGPALRLDDNGVERIVLDDVMLVRTAPGPIAFHLAGVGHKLSDVDWKNFRTADCPKAAFDGKARLELNRSEHIDGAVIYPSVGLFFSITKDPELGTALCRSYMHWLAEFCSADPKRLFGAVWVDLRDIDASIALAREAVTKYGFRAVACRPNRYASRNWFDPEYDRFWAAVQELGVPVGFHEGSSSGAGTAGVARYGDNRVLNHIVSHPFEQMLCCLSIIMGGVLERFPRLKVGFLESGCGWAHFWLDRMDEHFEKHISAYGELWGAVDMRENLKLKPSEYFLRQCIVSTESDDTCLPQLAAGLSDSNVVWGSDYPHIDAEFPGALHGLLKRSDLSPALLDKVLRTNPQSFYGIDISAS